jgi:hypothetical protein
MLLMRKALPRFGRVEVHGNSQPWIPYYAAHQDNFCDYLKRGGNDENTHRNALGFFGADRGWKTARKRQS